MCKIVLIFCSFLIPFLEIFATHLQTMLRHSARRLAPGGVSTRQLLAGRDASCLLTFWAFILKKVLLLEVREGEIRQKN